MEDEELSEFEFISEEACELDTHEEIDLSCEFDAPRFYDFTRPETHWEAVEAESWFEFATTYQPAAFAVKLNLRLDIALDNHSSYCNGENSTCCDCSIDDSDRGEFDNSVAQDSPKAKTKLRSKSSIFRSSTLMKPTASHLAKRNQCLDVRSNLSMRRYQRLAAKTDDKASRISSLVDRLTTKRQKLEAGYLCKVAHLKHQALFLHKPPKKAGGLLNTNSTHLRSKVTIPREPNLETAQRAQRHRSKDHAETDQQAKSNARTFKIFHAPALPSSRKNTQHLPEFQVFHLRTAERTMQQTPNNEANRCNRIYISRRETVDYRRIDSANGLKEEKCEAVYHSRATQLSKKEHAVDKRITNVSLADSFSKLSLAYKAQTDIRSRSKISLPANGFKENALSSLELEREMINVVKEKSKRFGGKQYHCGSGRRIPEIGSRLTLNRRLDIR